MLKQIALAAIGVYQRYLSPRKGYSCAYRVRTGGVGCSGFGKHAIGRHGLRLGLVLLRRRMAKCAWQAHKHSPCQPHLTARHPAARPSLGKFANQGGFVDCGGCDAPACDIPSCDLPSCDMPSCDMPHFGCGQASSGSEAANTFCSIAEGFGSCDPCSGTRSSGADCCGSGSGVQREDERLARARKRRDQANTPDDSAADIADFGDDDGRGDGD